MTAEPADYAPFLYIPAIHHDLEEVVFQHKIPGLRNLAICLEDAVRPDQRAEAALRLRPLIARLAHHPAGLRVYLRPADRDILRILLDSPGIAHIDGLILPKATPEKLAHWVDDTTRSLPILPILESRTALDPGGRTALADTCHNFRELIPRIRIGANDLFSLLGGLRRPRGKTVFETPVGHIVDSLMENFASSGIPLSGVAFDRLDDTETLLRECRDETERGLYCKTVLNPRQLRIVSEAYRPDPLEIEEAHRILNPDAPAVFGLHGIMHEPACHSAWATRTLRLASAFPSSDNR